MTRNWRHKPCESPWSFFPCSSDRKSTRLNSSHTVIYTLSLHDALPISPPHVSLVIAKVFGAHDKKLEAQAMRVALVILSVLVRSEEHTSELQSHRDLHSFPSRRSSDLPAAR